MTMNIGWLGVGVMGIGAFIFVILLFWDQAFRRLRKFYPFLAMLSVLIFLIGYGLLLYGIFLGT